uniref:Uncharacterized protein n=1 Tax=Leersia perrieri TaxID=77586 RepID=A0A0D9V8A1_9ORYZ
GTPSADPLSAAATEPLISSSPGEIAASTACGVPLPQYHSHRELVPSHKSPQRRSIPSACRNRRRHGRLRRRLSLQRALGLLSSSSSTLAEPGSKRINGNPVFVATHVGCLSSGKRLHDQRYRSEKSWVVTCEGARLPASYDASDALASLTVLGNTIKGSRPYQNSGVNAKYHPA